MYPYGRYHLLSISGSEKLHYETTKQLRAVVRLQVLES